MMLTMKRLLAVLVAAMAGAACAQTTVTPSGGTTDTVPAFTGTSALGNSLISVLDGAVGIGTATPGTTFQVISHAGGGTEISIDNDASYGSLDSTGTVRQTFGTSTITDIHMGHLDAGWGNNVYIHSANVSQILVNGSRGSWTYMETLLANGNVGIGAVSPTGSTFETSPTALVAEPR